MVRSTKSKLAPGSPDSRPVLIVRADADPTMGAGHIMRTLALAQAWQYEGGTAVFAVAGLPGAIADRLAAEGVETVPLSVPRGSPEDGRAVLRLARARGADWVVVDGYHFEADYHCALRDAGLRVLLMDDGGGHSSYCPTFVLNQNPQAGPEMYRGRQPETELLLGTRFALLRREFWKWRRWERRIPDIATKVLVTFGGGDSRNGIEKAVRALGMMLPGGGLECVVAVGAMSPRSAALKATADALGMSVEVHDGVSDMAELMAWAEIAVGAAGSTSLELAFMGLPALLVVTADNQRPLAECLSNYGSAVDLGRSEALDEAELARRVQALAESRTTRESMTSAGRHLVDGYGASRVVQRLRGDKVRLRDATAGDAELLWRWANEPQTRANSFSPHVIGWSDHVSWLDQHLNSSSSRLLVAVDSNDIAVGQARLDADGQGAILSISVDKELRHQGFGLAIIQLVLREAVRSPGVAWVDALIKPENEASLRVFSRAGFVTAPRSAAERGVEYLRYRWRPDDLQSDPER
jgi:UDP-2,4-diacetamido-2,4,6-trideoxy-beta-L-altropyranose hydrolase